LETIRACMADRTIARIASSSAAAARWETRKSKEAFGTSGPSDSRNAAIAARSSGDSVAGAGRAGGAALRPLRARGTETAGRGCGRSRRAAAKAPAIRASAAAATPASRS
jgi:hypothetical protein